jgi:PAS domain S-box-containing protein
MDTITKSNEKFEKIFKESPVSTTLSTLNEGRYVDVNNAFLQAMGMSTNEVVEKTSCEIGHITEEQRMNLFNALNNKGYVEKLELQVKIKEGQVREGFFNAVMMTIDNEKYILTDMADITERKQPEKTLLENEERFRSLVESENS